MLTQRLTDPNQPTLICCYCIINAHMMYRFWYQKKYDDGSGSIGGWMKGYGFGKIINILFSRTEGITFSLYSSMFKHIVSRDPAEKRGQWLCLMHLLKL